MKLCLGTVQFGLDYGLTNSDGQVSVQEAASILKAAHDNGITQLDTASAYGNSENVLGELGASRHFSILSKAPPQCDPDQISTVLHQSLRNLKCSALDALYLHHASDFLDEKGHHRYEQLRQAMDMGLISGIGASVYSLHDAHEILNRFKINMIQLPVNVFDQRFLDDIIPQCKEAGIQVYARSLFLQGCLLSHTTPSGLHSFSSQFSKWHSFCATNNLSLLEGCLHFANSISSIDYWVIGVQNTAQLNETLNTLKLVKESSKPYDFSELLSRDQTLINPSQWEIS